MGSENTPTSGPENVFTDSEWQNAVFARLARHGIDYQQVRPLVEIDTPAWLLFFATQYGRRAFKEVLRHIESWKKHLERDYLLSVDEKSRLTNSIQQTEGLVWKGIWEANGRVGDWTLEGRWTPIGTVVTADGERLGNGQSIRATNRITGEIRVCELVGDLPSVPRPLADEIKEIYTRLGLMDQLWLKAPFPFILNDRRSPQGRPVYARIIPRLYEYMLPHYESRGRYSEVRDRDNVGELERAAVYPKELLEDMRDLLKMHHPHVFGKTTIGQLKALIQRHRERKSRPKR